MQVRKLQIYDMSGVERIDIVGEINSENILNTLITEWIPYTECDQCGRSDYCKFTKPNKYRPNELADIKCGVIVTALENFIKHTFGTTEAMSHEQIQAYLDGAFHLTQFLHESEQTTGAFIDSSIMQWFGEYAPRLYGRTVHLREHLNRAAVEFKKLPEMDSKKGVVFVEGETEQAFLVKLKESHSAWFIDLLIEVYGGNGNRNPNRIQMLLENYKTKGYTIYIQGDADGSSRQQFEKLCKKGCVSQNNTFTFKHDFESSIPPELLYYALESLSKTTEISKEDFCAILTNSSRRAESIIMEHFNLDINPLKIQIAEAIGDNLNNPMNIWWNNERFMESELGGFLDFIMRVQ